MTKCSSKTGRPELHAAASKGFQLGADAYDRGRPEYPEEAVAKLTHELRLTAEKTIVDLGAGTGKFTNLLVKRAPANVIAVEPVDGMRKKFSTLHPDIEIQPGSAESMVFANSSVDAVIAAQAFHWFDGEKALAEIHRIFKPGAVSC